ncbi:hypothetical protein ACQJBY_072158 [Aegilops geniculata]
MRAAPPCPATFPRQRRPPPIHFLSPPAPSSPNPPSSLAGVVLPRPILFAFPRHRRTSLSPRSVATRTTGSRARRPFPPLEFLGHRRPSAISGGRAWGGGRRRSPAGSLSTNIRRPPLDLVSRPQCLCCPPGLSRRRRRLIGPSGRRPPRHRNETPSSSHSSPWTAAQSPSPARGFSRRSLGSSSLSPLWHF